MALQVDGIPMFGDCVKYFLGDVPRETQYVAGAGLDGVIALDLGGRGMRGFVTGFVYDSTAALFASAWLGLERLQDGRSHVLNDPLLSRYWPRVKFENLRSLREKFPEYSPGKYKYWGMYQIDVIALTYQQGR